jgi:hypothetical protein
MTTLLFSSLALSNGPYARVEKKYYLNSGRGLSIIFVKLLGTLFHRNLSNTSEPSNVGS